MVLKGILVVACIMYRLSTWALTRGGWWCIYSTLLLLRKQVAFIWVAVAPLGLDWDLAYALAGEPLTTTLR